MNNSPEPKNQMAAARFDECLAEMPLAGTGVGFNNHALPRAVHQAKRAGIPADEVIKRIIATQANASRNVETEVRNTVENIYAIEGESKRSDRKPFDEFKPELTSRVVTESPGGITQLREASPVKGLAQHAPAFFLPKLFPGNPLVTIGTTDLEPVTELVTDLKAKTGKQSCGFEYIVPSAARKQYGETKQGKGSRKADDTIGERQHIVIEFDHNSKDEAASIILHLAQFAPLVMALDSGGKSIHSWFSCEGVTERNVWEFFNYAVTLGADTAIWTRSQWVRLPNAMRKKSGELQEVLYFDGEASDKPWTTGKVPWSSIEVFGILSLPTDHDEDKNLLGNRFLMRGQGILVAAPTAAGKSTLVTQAPMLWACGMDFFGIRPAHPLRTLIIQAENDPDEIRCAVANMMSLITPLQSHARDIDANVLISTFNGYTINWRDAILPIVMGYKFDLLVMDPLLAYYKGNVSEQEGVSRFLREEVQPFLKEHGLGAVITHHTVKPPRAAEKGGWANGDFAYSGAGSSEFGNWPRGVIVLKQDRDDKGLFELHVAKRWKSAGLLDANGVPTDRIHVRHSDEGICWNRAETPAPKLDKDLFDLAIGFLKAERNGKARIEAVGKAIDLDPKTVRRRFKNANPLDIPGADGREALKLQLGDGKIVNLLEVDATGISLRE
ncbi:MAG TPA: AAA family ATPase [Candidatus Acidoferrum sp.]|nr:AAA family ATPase [Candidatus Acidoferrum sp.]